MAKINFNREQVARFVQNNKKQIIAASILFLLGIIVLAVLFKLNYDFIKQSRDEPVQQQTGSEAAGSPEPGALSTYLPDTSRRLEVNQEIRDPFSRGMVLTGIITGGSGGNLAVIESGTTSFVVGPGDEIAGGWTVVEIKTGAVILEMGANKVQLEFNGRVKDLTPQTSLAETTTGESTEGSAEGPAQISSEEVPARDTEISGQGDNRLSEPGKEGE